MSSEPVSGPAAGGAGLSVSLGLWQDRPAAEVVRTAEAADALKRELRDELRH